MGQNTSRLGLYLPGGGSTGLITPDEPADIDKINDNMQKLDADAGAYVCTSSTRPSTPYNGKIIYETDTKNTRVWRTSNSTWELVSLPQTVPVANGGTGATSLSDAQDNLRVGLMPISPSSVAITAGTSTVSTMGMITLTGSGTTNVNGVFSTAYSKYLIILDGIQTSTGADIFIKLRSGTTDASTDYYYNQVNIDNATLLGESGVGVTTGCPVGVTGNVTAGGSAEITVYRPATVEVTNINASFNGYISAARMKVSRGFHNVSASYTGFTIYCTNSATLKGSIQVFGYNS